MTKIACVIVTYNRKELLVNCLRAVLSQTRLPGVVYVVDNASTDGTEEYIVEKGFKTDSEAIPAGMTYVYLRLPENIGGAGGFYTGMKRAYDEGYDAVWVMDDDGVPEADCLELLSQQLDKYDYIAPEVLNIDDTREMAFEYCGERISFESGGRKDGLVHGVACPFNGILYSRRLMEQVGFPKKEMFIWGDEENYDMRCRRAGFTPVTVVAARHCHPVNRVMTARSLLGPIDVAPQMWRCYCRYRNAMYNHREDMSSLGKAYVFINHVWYYLLKRHSLRWTAMYVQAFQDGLRGDFMHLAKYKN